MRGLSPGTSGDDSRGAIIESFVTSLFLGCPDMLALLLPSQKGLPDKAFVKYIECSMFEVL